MYAINMNRFKYGVKKMNTIIIVLLGVSLLLFALSFIQKDRYRLLEKEVEEVSINYLQENYQIKKRLKVLEEELLVENGEFIKVHTDTKHNLGQKPIHEIVKNQVISLHQQGVHVDQIAKQSALSTFEVKKIINSLK
jgi:hypothetical protein